MKNPAPQPEKKTRRATLHAAGERQLSEILNDHSVYRLAKIAASFAANGHGFVRSIYSARRLLGLCSRMIASDSRYFAILELETPGPDSLNLSQLLAVVKVTPKTLKSYILEAFWDIQEDVRCDGPGLDIDEQSIGDRIWDRLLAGEAVVSPATLEKIQSIRKRRFAESRKKPKKSVK